MPERAVALLDRMLRGRDIESDAKRMASMWKSGEVDGPVEPWMRELAGDRHDSGGRAFLEALARHGEDSDLKRLAEDALNDRGAGQQQGTGEPVAEAEPAVDAGEPDGAGSMPEEPALPQVLSRLRAIADDASLSAVDRDRGFDRVLDDARYASDVSGSALVEPVAELAQQLDARARMSLVGWLATNAE
jgi:hypothetical protein